MARLTPLFPLPSSAHEFYTFSMGARLSIVASAPLYVPLLSRTHIQKTHTHTEAQCAHLYTHLQIHVTRYVENARFPGARDAIKSGF